jgi:GTP-binding protein LepA
MLHMDVFMQRLQQEYGAEVLATPPTVPYKGVHTYSCKTLRAYLQLNFLVVLKNETEKMVSNPVDYPEEEEIDYVEEPIVEASIVVPNECIYFFIVKLLLFFNIFL